MSFDNKEVMYKLNEEAKLNIPITDIVLIRKAVDAFCNKSFHRSINRHVWMKMCDEYPYYTMKCVIELQNEKSWCVII